MNRTWWITATITLTLVAGAAAAQGRSTPSTRLVSPNTRLVPPRTGLVAPNTRLIPPDTRLIPPDTRLSRPGTGLVAPDTTPFIPGGSPFIPDTRPFVPNTRPFVPNTNPFVPGTQPFVPDTGLESPIDGTGSDSTFLGFTPGVTPGNEYLPSTGGGGGFYYDPYWDYGGYSGPLVDGTGAWLRQGFGFGWGSRRGLPVLGLTTPPLRPQGAREARLRSQISLDREQDRVAKRLANVMEDHTLTEGTVVRVDADGVTVRFREDGVSRRKPFAPEQVFLLQGGDRLWNAATSPQPPQPGDPVLVPLPVRSAFRKTR